MARQCRFALGSGYLCKEVHKYGAVLAVAGTAQYAIRPLVYFCAASTVRGLPGVGLPVAVLLGAVVALFGVLDMGSPFVGDGVVSAFVVVVTAWAVADVLRTIGALNERMAVKYLNCVAFLWFLQPLFGGRSVLVSVLLVVCIVSATKFQVAVPETDVGDWHGVEWLGGAMVKDTVWRRLQILRKHKTVDPEWAGVRALAVIGDHYLKVLLMSYVRSRGGTVADESRLEQSLMTDRSMINFVGTAAFKGDVAMCGKPAATMLEAVWGVAYEVVVAEAVAGVPGRFTMAVSSCFEHFLHGMARKNGYVLNGLQLVDSSVGGGVDVFESLVDSWH
jgi:hypothetical protein